MIERTDILASNYYTFFEHYLRKLYDIIEQLYGKLQSKDKELANLSSTAYESLLISKNAYLAF